MEIAEAAEAALELATDVGRADATEDELAGSWWTGRARGLTLTEPGGLLGWVTKRVLDAALEGEMDSRLGYAKQDLRPGRWELATGARPRQCH